MDDKPFSVVLVDVPRIDQVWPLIADGLESACRKTGGDIASTYLWSECRSGAAYLLVVVTPTGILAATVLRFESWHTGKKLRCLALYGQNAKDWLPELRRVVTDMARVGGANGLVADGRKGNERLFPDAKVLREVFEVTLDGGQ